MSPSYDVALARGYTAALARHATDELRKLRSRSANKTFYIPVLRLIPLR